MVLLAAHLHQSVKKSAAQKDKEAKLSEAQLPQSRKQWAGGRQARKLLTSTC